MVFFQTRLSDTCGGSGGGGGDGGGGARKTKFHQ